MTQVSTYLKREIEFCIRDIGFRLDSRHISYHVDYRVDKKRIILEGFVHFRQQENALISAIQSLLRKKRKKIEVRSEIKILSRKKFRFAQVISPFAGMHLSPEKNGEVGTQLLCGAFIIVYFNRGRYVYASAPDGYLGYVHKDHIIFNDKKGYLKWLNGRRLRILADAEIKGYFLPAGSEFIGSGAREAQLPDGNSIDLGKIKTAIHNPAKIPGIGKMIDMARTYLGTPYVWGGKGSRGLDCSGFTQILFQSQGMVLPRDASQQITVGRLVGLLGDFTDVLPGDLLFFMSNSARINHVGISTGKDRFMHATIKHGITESSIDDPDLGGSPFRNIYIFGRRMYV